MAITYESIKSELVDLGFEIDEEVENEYKRVRINAINRAMDVMWIDIILPFMDYFSKQYDLDEEEGFTHFTLDSEDEDETNVPDFLKPLLSLLSAHWLWLDDDLTKATIYWNEYDDKKNNVLSNLRTPRKATIVGGF